MIGGASMGKNVYKDSGRSVPLQTDDEGYPLCPQDGLRLVEESPGYWTCPLTVAFEDAIRLALMDAQIDGLDGAGKLEQ